jgi:hypothetical protein
MFCRRLIVFVRERRQWFLTLSPFINIIMPLLIVYGFYGMHTSGERAGLVRLIINFTVALMFPYILNTGYATTSGIYMLMPVEERANKTRQILKMNGM